MSRLAPSAALAISIAAWRVVSSMYFLSLLIVIVIAVAQKWKIQDEVLTRQSQGQQPPPCLPQQISQWHSSQLHQRSGTCGFVHGHSRGAQAAR